MTKKQVEFSDALLNHSEKMVKLEIQFSEVYSKIEPFLEKTKLHARKFSNAIETIYPMYETFMDNSFKCGWTPLMNWEINYDFYEKANKLSLEKLNQFYLKELTKKEFNMVFYLLDELAENLESGYKIEVEKISKILKVNINNYTLAIPYLFSLIDYMIVFQMNSGEIPSNAFMRNREVKIYAKKNKIREDDLISFYKLHYYYCVQLVDEYSEFVEFSNPTFNRHHVLHGRYDPAKYTFANFLRLLVLCAHLSLAMGKDDEFLLISE